MKNGVIYLVITFTSGIMIIKMSKRLFFRLSVDDSKKLVLVSAKYLSAAERFYLAFSEHAMDC